ncbi:MAG TPA: hypothetical protein VGI06_06880 [Acidimicrobiales bacterium]
MTATHPAPVPDRLEGLSAALADVVCWMVFYLQHCQDDEVDPEVADELSSVIASSLRRLPVHSRLLFLEHASGRAGSSGIADYQEFLLELAETLGLE